jgi:IS30 family transposase
MSRKKRSYRFFDATESAELFARWRNGENVQAIARELEREPNSIRTRLLASGGFTPPVPKRSPHHLTEVDREDISRGLAQGLSYQCIARRIKRAASTVKREVDRNGGRSLYRFVTAGQRAIEQRARPKPCKLATNRRLQRRVCRDLKRRLSPEQIAGQLKLESSNPTMQISHETIYKSLFIQTRGVLRGELRNKLRTGRQMRHGKRARTDRRGQIPNAISIRERPADSADRALPGHWEGDLLAGTQSSFIATLVERSTRFLILVRVTSKETDVVIDALIKKMKKLPAQLRRSLTLDRGTEFSQHARFSLETNLAVYFCDPRSPWQRGSNENTNGLLRQYFPKGGDVSGYTQSQLDKVANELNTRPRETLGFRTPAYMLNLALQ